MEKDRGLAHTFELNTRKSKEESQVDTRVIFELVGLCKVEFQLVEFFKITVSGG